MTVNLDALPADVRLAVEAAQNKKAVGIVVLDLSGLGAFTGHFIICTGFSSRQVQAISDAIEEQFAGMRRVLRHREGLPSAEWVLLDFGGFLVHVFSETARRYYDLERLWRTAKRLEIPDEPSGMLPDAAATGL
ncbi:MAG: ribosome silencing factor [Burkholderiales bacterium]